jgi:hypothetical protein
MHRAVVEEEEVEVVVEVVEEEVGAVLTPFIAIAAAAAHVARARTPTR